MATSQRTGAQAHHETSRVRDRPERPEQECRRRLRRVSDMLDALTHAEQRLEDFLSRRSVSPKRLRAPCPDADELEAIVQAALRAPDHGGLMPWRLIEFRPETRDMLARCFEQEKLRRDPLAGEFDLRLARE